ncbi:EamA family transporter RarD [Novosphingopyxis baekryungensis]|uniref:EamA family transporter RarD n=1 Tax=Novosphingopyxis baekryungensis TaxID=279369 RepID=UPI0003B5E1DE|nr:EamA family transporter RarD [Novosphingopyxis baekryungensis]
MTSAAAAAPPPEKGSGLAQGIGAYLAWGFMPLFFKQLTSVPAVEVVAHRVIWSVPLLLLILAIRRQLPSFWAVLRTPQTRWLMLLSSTLIAANWLIYVYAVFADHILAASLGYYLTPLLNVLLGYFFLKEGMTRATFVALLLAMIGVAILAAGALDTLWISLALAFSFGMYGLVRKLAPVGSMPGLTAETVILSPVALGAVAWFWMYGGSGGFGSSLKIDLLLIAGGAVTAFPLLMFAGAARRMRLTALGFISYIGPTIQFLLGVLLYDEPLTTPRLACFALIWFALVIFSVDSVRRSRRGEAL